MAEFRIIHTRKTWPGGLVEDSFLVTKDRKPVDFLVISEPHIAKDPTLLAYVEGRGFFTNPYPTLDIAKEVISAMEYIPPTPVVVKKTLDKNGDEVQFVSSIDDDDPRFKGDPDPFSGGAFVVIAAAVSALVMAFIHKSWGIW